VRSSQLASQARPTAFDNEQNWQKPFNPRGEGREQEKDALSSPKIIDHEQGSKEEKDYNNYTYIEAKS